MEADQERAVAVRENVTITYRGARYEFGHGQNFYGIWAIGAPGPQPLEWWPQTPAGWSGAWSRFNGIEAPGSIVPVGQPAPQPVAAQGYAPAPYAPAPYAFAAQGQAGPLPYGNQSFTAPSAAPPGPAGPGFARPAATPAAAALAAAGARRVLAAGLLAVGVIVGIVGLFPVYLQGASLASDAPELVPHLIYFAAWAASAVLILLGGNRARAGALLGLGTSIVTFGLFFSDLGTPIAYGSRFMGAGLVLALIGWAVCAAGSAVAFRLGPDGAPVRPRGFEIGSLAMVALAAIGTAIAFAPSWDSYLVQSASGSTTITEGDAFANPGAVIAGNVAVMVAVVLVAVLAGLWRPRRLGAALLAGATIPMVAQAISAVIQVAQGTTAANLLGIPPAQAQAAGLTVSSGVTAAFWLYCAFVLVMILLCVRMLTMSGRAVAAAAPGVARPLAFPGSGPDTFRADGQHAFAPPQTTAVAEGASPGAHPVAAGAEPMDDLDGEYPADLDDRDPSALSDEPTDENPVIPAEG